MIRNWNAIAILLAFTVMATVGCDTSGSKNNTSSTTSVANTKVENKTEGPPTTEEIAAAASARKILNACIAKYKKLRSYEDRGVFKLRLTVTDEPIVESDLMQVAFEFPNRLAIRAIDLQALSTKDSWEAVVGKGISKPFGNQRLVRPSPESIDLKWLLIDNVGASLDMREIGAPMQLQLLFDEKPLPYLLSPEAKLTQLSQEMFDGANCDRVQIVSLGKKWTLWIDAQENLLRKYEMSDLEFSKMELAVELVGAKADLRVDWSNWKLPEQDKDLAVRRFIDAPPRDIPLLLGKNLKPFDLLNSDGKVILDSAQRAKPITVLCWVGDDEISEKFVKYALDVSKEFDRLSLSNSAEIMFVSTAPATKMKDAFQRWKCDFPLAIDTENLTKSLFLINRQPAIVVLDKDVVVQHFDEVGYLDLLPEIVDTLQKGINRAARIRQNSLDDESRFTSRLHRVIVDDSKIDQLAPIAPFVFTFHPTVEAWNVPFDAKIIAAGGEQFYPEQGKTVVTPDLFVTSARPARLLSVLDELGNVYVVDNVGKKRLIAKIPIERADNALRIHVSPDPWTHRWIAIVPEGLPRYWLAEMPDNWSQNNNAEPVDATEFTLAETESPTCFAWTVQGGKPSLTLATDASRLVVLDPETSKSSKGDATNVATIVPSLNDRGNCIGWNVLDFERNLIPIENLPSHNSTADNEESSIGIGNKISFTPELGAWTWGRNRDGALMLGLAKLPSGETGSKLQTGKREQLFTHALSVRAKQCRILSSTSHPQGRFYWLATAPRPVLHLQTMDGDSPDQMSLGKPILGAAIFPDGDMLRLVIAVDSEVICLKVSIPSIQPVPESVSPLEKTRG